MTASSKSLGAAAPAKTSGFSVNVAIVAATLLIALNPLTIRFFVKYGILGDVYLIALDLCLVAVIALAVMHLRTGRRGYAVLAGAALAATLPVMVVAELVLTYLYIRYQTVWTGATVAQVYEPDPKLGWRLKPGASGRHILSGDYDATYHIDRFGRRVLPTANVAAPTVHVFGSSFTFSDGVDDDEAALYLIADANRNRFQMRNYSVSAYGLDQMVLSLDLHRNEIAPGDIVLLPTTSMSVGWNWIARGPVCQFRLGEGAYPIGKYPVLTEDGWRFHDVFEECGLVETLLLASPLPAGALYSNSRAESVQRATAAHADRLLAYARQVTEERGARFVPVLVVSADECVSKSFNFDLTGLETRLLSMMPSCPEDATDFRRMRFEKDWHYTVEGNRWFAEALAQTLLHDLPKPADGSISAR